jgi:hypothetical protein
MFKAIRKFLGKAYRTVKLFTNPGKSIVKIVGDTIRDVATQYPPQVRQVLAIHGTHRITNIKLCKEVVSQNMEFLMKALAGAKTWEEAKRRNGFDKFYHLFMIVTMENGSVLHVEKNEIIRVAENPRPCPDALDLGSPSSITVSEMFDRTRERIGDRDFFTYDPFTNNCQSFITQLLKTMGLSNQTSSSFVYQNIDGLREDLPGYTKFLARGLTDVGAFFNTAYQKTVDYINNGKAERTDNITDAS